MIFGDEPIERAVGGILAHSQALGKGRLRKGRVLTAQDVAALAAAGIDSVMTARLEPGDQGEDEAAARIAAHLVPDPGGQGLRLSQASTGRVNIYAEAAGVVAIDAAAIAALNRVDPMITVATVPALARVARGDMVATVKIIAYGVARASLAAAEQTAPRAISLCPVRLRSATLIETRIGPGDPEKGEKAIRARLAELEVDLAESLQVPHRIAALSEALAAAGTDLVLILTASATSDPDDVGPAALRRAGGEVTRFGMPVDPGNLLFVGRLGGRPVVGLPGCARSPALNGADWVLERLICGVPVTDDDIAAMGVGGLLKESPARGRPREGREK